MSRRISALAVALTLVMAACSSGSNPVPAPASATSSVALGAGHPTAEPISGSRATFNVTPGVEQVTVTGASPRARLTLVNAASQKLVTLIADDHGQAVFAYVPDDYMTVETGTGRTPTARGRSLKKGDGFWIRDETSTVQADSERFAVMGRDDHPPASLYDAQTLRGIHWSIVGGPKGERQAAEGLQYILMRDGVQLSAMVRLPDPGVYGDGPYPTVVEYSGYDPSNPDSLQPGTMIANSLGFATVGVNMRGTGCSGGVFDVFNPAQQADGYDLIEVIARQPWVLHNRVGMVGLSYSGISQLYVASTRPPGLAAITPLSVIEDPWKMSWPGGIYNAGFTKQWLAERDRQAMANGQSWVAKRVAAGDEICATNQQIRSQNMDFEEFSHSLEFRPADSDDRDLAHLVKDIEVPVYLSGAWQDEQTGPRFATMLDSFTGTTRKHFVLFNGHHPDGYAPTNLSRWLEFLQLYVARQVPHINPLVRAGAPATFRGTFGVDGLSFAPDRFADLSGRYDEALERWEADPAVRVLMESGNSANLPAGAPAPRYEVTFDSWPPPSAHPWELWFGQDGALSADRPSLGGTDKYQVDPAAGPIGYARAGAYDFMKPTVAVDWQDTPAGKGLSYVTDPLDTDSVIAGPGYANLWFRSDADDADIEVVLSGIQPDGTEVRIQNGLLRAGHRKVDNSRNKGPLIEHSYDLSDYERLPAGEFVEVKVPIFPVMHALRTGSRLRVQVNTPGRDLPLWFFELPDRGGPDIWQHVARSRDMASGVVLSVLPEGAIPVPGGYPPCPSLRGQPCRPYHPLANIADNTQR